MWHLHRQVVKQNLWLGIGILVHVLTSVGIKVDCIIIHYSLHLLSCDSFRQLGCILSCDFRLRILFLVPTCVPAFVPSIGNRKNDE